MKTTDQLEKELFALKMRMDMMSSGVEKEDDLNFPGMSYEQYEDTTAQGEHPDQRENVDDDTEAQVSGDEQHSIGRLTNNAMEIKNWNAGTTVTPNDDTLVHVRTLVGKVSNFINKSAFTSWISSTVTVLFANISDWATAFPTWWGTWAPTYHAHSQHSDFTDDSHANTARGGTGGAAATSYVDLDGVESRNAFANAAFLGDAGGGKSINPSLRKLYTSGGTEIIDYSAPPGFNLTMAGAAFAVGGVGGATNTQGVYFVDVNGAQVGPYYLRGGITCPS